MALHQKYTTIANNLNKFVPVFFFMYIKTFQFFFILEINLYRTTNRRNFISYLVTAISLKKHASKKKKKKSFLKPVSPYYFETKISPESFQLQ